MTTTRVLIVEDERVVALSLRNQLQDLGYEVPAMAHSGEEAVRKAEEIRPDLVLMDIQLEGAMDGVEAAGLIQRQLQLPVVYLTAYSTRDVLERAKVTEPYGYVLKPYEERELHVVIEMALYKHRMEAELRQRERWLAATLRSIGDGVITTDAKERITFLNPVAEQLTDWSLEEGIGRDLTEVFRIINEATRLPVESPLRKALRDKTTVPLDNHTLLVARNKSEKPIDDCASPILGENGQVVGGVLVFRDMTERKKADERFLQAQKMEAIGRLAGGVAHDFNNMMTVVTGFSQILLASLPLNDPTRPRIEEIKKAGDRAAGLTAQLLAFSRRQMLQLKVIDLNAVVTNLRMMLVPMIGEDVDLVTRLGSGLARVKADPGQVEQVLMNLAVNGRDAMPTGGALTIETSNARLEAGDLADVEDVRPGPYVLLRVSDTGMGMDGETLAHLFEPFFTTKSIGQGTGLGLATVYGVVKQSGGHILVESQVGRGTTFSVYFPAIEEIDPPQAMVDGTQIPLGGRETVLLVEDEDSVRILGRHILEQLGYRVLMAAGGAEAVEKARVHEGNIDLLVTDVVMPRMSGQDLAERLRRVYPTLKVLFLSGYTEDAVLRRGVSKTAGAFLQKPFTVAALGQIVREVLDRPFGAYVAQGADPKSGCSSSCSESGPS